MDDESKQDRELMLNLYVQIFGVAGAMVGVCLTVIGLLRLLTEVKGYRTLGDDLVAVDGIVFLLACVFAFLTLKAHRSPRQRMFQRLTDTFFMTGIALMMVICAVITWAFAHIRNG